MGEKVYLTAEELAEIIRCTPRNVKHLIKRGEIPAIRFGRGKWLVPKAWVDNLSREQKQEIIND